MKMVLVNVNTITLILLIIVVVTSAAAGNTNLRRSIATTKDDTELPYTTTATLNDDDTNTNNNIKHSPTLRKKNNNKIRSRLNVSPNHRRLVLDNAMIQDNKEGRNKETTVSTTVESEQRELAYRYNGICKPNGQFKVKFRVTVDSNSDLIGADEKTMLEQLSTFYKQYVSEFNPIDYNNVTMIYYSSLVPTEEEEGRPSVITSSEGTTVVQGGTLFDLWIDGDCIGDVDPDVFLARVHGFLTADSNLGTTLGGEVSVMNCKRLRNSYTCKTVIPWVSEATTTSTPVTSTSSTTAMAGTSSTTVEPITTSSTTQVQVSGTPNPTRQPSKNPSRQPSKNPVTNKPTTKPSTKPNTPTPTRQPSNIPSRQPSKNPSQSPITAVPTTDAPTLSPVTNELTKNPSQSPITEPPTTSYPTYSTYSPTSTGPFSTSSPTSMPT